MKLFTIVAIYIFLFFSILFITKHTENFGIPTGHERPFVNVYGNDGEQLKIILLSHPFTRDSSWEQYKKYKEDGFLVLGISSYSEFPKITSNHHDVLHNPEEKAWKNYDYMKLVEGWLHCFRNPDKFIDVGIPKSLISESDFCNKDVYKPDDLIKKIYDFIYICPKDSDNNCDGWVAFNKNWELAKKCLKYMCGKLKLKGLLVGRKGCSLPSVCNGLVETTDFLTQDELINSYRKSKFIFIPNVSDASPRILVEALCCNIPALVNYNILGGWKYINDNTGAFFTNEHDVKEALDKILYDSNHKPRHHYLEKWGEENSGKRFKAFIQEHFNSKIDVSKYEYLKL